MLSSYFFISSRRCIEHRFGACTTRVTFAPVVIWKVPSKVPISPNLSAYSLHTASLQLMGMFWEVLAFTSQIMITKLRALHDDRPIIAGPGVSAT